MTGLVNALFPCLDRLFEVISPLLHDGGMNNTEHPINAEELRQHIKEAMSSFERTAQEQAVCPESIAKATYGLIALIDELVIHKGGEISALWISHPLQLEYFGENRAGQYFFVHLDALRLQSELFIDVLEIYYLCLALGFEGKYRAQSQSMLFKLKQELRSQIQQIRQDSNTSLYIAASKSQADNDEKTTTRLNMFSVIGAVILFITAMGLMATISYQAHQDRKVILAYQQALSNALTPQRAHHEI